MLISRNRQSKISRYDALAVEYRITEHSTYYEIDCIEMK